MSKVDYDKAQTAYTTAKNNLDNANQNLEIAKNKLKDTENGATQENKIRLRLVLTKHRQVWHRHKPV